MGVLTPYPRALTAAQRRVLVAMDPLRPCDAWARSPRLITLYELEARGLIVQGRSGWLDASLTQAGRALQGALDRDREFRDAAE